LADIFPFFKNEQAYAIAFAGSNPSPKYVIDIPNEATLRYEGDIEIHDSRKGEGAPVELS
jgi:hypothetical protein